MSMMQFDNTQIRRRNPIKRNNKFFSKEDFDLEIHLGREYVEDDMNQTVVLYQVDLEKTKINNIYKEAAKGDIHFKTPVEVQVVYEIEDAELKSYEKQQNKMVYSKTGKLKFGVYEQTLIELECDIKRGDYIGIQVTPEHMEMFVVTNDGRINYSNKMSYYGTRPYYRSIECSPVTEDLSELNM